jgi:hypothetical protein
LLLCLLGYEEHARTRDMEKERSIDRIEKWMTPIDRMLAGWRPD